MTTIQHLYKNTNCSDGEYYLGNDKYLYIPHEYMKMMAVINDVEVRTKNPYRDMFNNVAEQIGDNKQKYLNKSFDVGCVYLTTSKRIVDEFEKLNPTLNHLTEENCVEYANKFEKYLRDGISEYCDGMFSNNGVNVSLCSERENIKNKLTKKYDGLFYYEYFVRITFKGRIMDVDKWTNEMKLIWNWDKLYLLNEDNLVGRKICAYICDNIGMMYSKRFCNRKNFVGTQGYNRCEDAIGRDCYKGDAYITLIDVMYVRAGKARNGSALPNRVYKKDSCEEIDNPYSFYGRAENLRKCLAKNLVPRFSKMNKTQMVEVLMKL